MRRRNVPHGPGHPLHEAWLGHHEAFGHFGPPGPPPFPPLPFWDELAAHPDYDEFWQKQSVSPYLTRVTVPTPSSTRSTKPAAATTFSGTRPANSWSALMFSSIKLWRMRRSSGG